MTARRSGSPPATNVTGVGGDLRSGRSRCAATFRASVPICNQWDITTPFVTNTAGEDVPVGDEVTGPGTGGRSGTRIFQRSRAPPDAGELADAAHDAAREASPVAELELLELPDGRSPTPTSRPQAGAPVLSTF